MKGARSVEKTKTVYESPRIEIIYFEADDMIATSSDWDTDIDTDL